MTLVIETQPLPLTLDTDGAVRVGGTCVTLGTVIEAFLQGATAEEIAYQYPSLTLSDIYSVIAITYDNAPRSKSNLRRRQQQAAKVKKHNEAQFDPDGVRDRLLARRTDKGQ
jgi:uncharacterized protein (DUF433 family)